MKALGVLVASLLGALPAAARPLAERVAALEAQAGLVLRAPASEDGELVDAVEAALALLPPALRHPPGGPLELVLHPEPAPLGLGNASARRPEWSEGSRRFHLYAFVPSSERRATLRTARLSDVEVERLWRRRAVVHAVMRRWDEARGWSRTARWRRLSGWLSPLERPLTFVEAPRLSYDGAFSRARGRDSAALDWLTFAEEFFVPVESLREEALSGDERVRCQEFSKSRALEELLAADGLGPVAPRPACPAFDAWARAGELSHFEVLLVASTGRQPESLFGHLMLRPVWREGTRVQGPSFESVVQPVALTGVASGGPSYVLQGLTGGFSLAFLTATRGDLAHETLELEQRTVRRFRLRLTPGEGTRLLERVWELERRGYLPYFFATDNCASALLFLLNGALEDAREVRAPGVLWVLPGATLDALTRVRVPGPGGEPQPLLEHVADDFESTGDRALRAHASRSEVLETLASRMAPGLATRWRLLHRRLSSPDPGTRQQAWARVPALVDATLAAGAGAPEREGVHAYLAHSVWVERAEVDRFEERRLEVERARWTAVRGALPTPQDAERERQRLFEREDEVQRHLAALDRLALFEQALATADKREPTPEEARLLARARAVEATFLTATDIQGALQDGALSSVDALDFLARDSARKREAEEARAGRAWHGSGAARLAVGGGVDVRPLGGVRPVLSLRTSALREGLGESFLHGFRPSSELRVLDGELRLEPGRGLPRVLDSRLTLLGYRTLLREPPWHRDTPLDELGWGGEVLLETRETPRDLRHRATVQAEALLVVDEGPDFRHYAALGVGGRAALRWGEALVPGAGPRLSFSQRVALPGSSLNAVRLEAAWAPVFLLSRGMRHEADASLQVEWLVNPQGRRALRLSPRAWVHWEEGGRAEPHLDLALELL